MVNRLETEYQGRKYFWTERGGIVRDDFMVPPKRLKVILEAQLAPAIAECDAAADDFQTLLDMSKAAKLNEDLPRAQRLAERALKMAPAHSGAAAVLCSVLRKRNRPAEALASTEAFEHAGDPVLLTTRAAALVDLERREEALKVTKKAWAIAKRMGLPLQELSALFRRLKAEGSP